MHPNSFALCCHFVFLFFVAESSQLWREAYTSNDTTTQYESNDDTAVKEERDAETEREDYNENAEDDNEARYESSYINSTKKNHEIDDSMECDSRIVRKLEENNRMIIDLDANRDTDVEAESPSSVSRVPRDPDEDNNGAECIDNDCIQLCCPLGERLTALKCVPGEGNYSFPVVRGCGTNDSSQIRQARALDRVFQLIVRDPCETYGYYLLLSETNLTGNRYEILANGSLYSWRLDSLVNSSDYCLAVVHRDKYDVVICQQDQFPIFLTVGVVLSLPFLLATFVIYSILPELQNMHGYTLRAHVSSLFVTYLVLAVYQQTTLHQLGYTVCLTLALLLTFSFSASFFWLNVMCFDIWWIFRRKTRSMRGNVKQRERRKFMLYALYGWGCAFILIIVCVMVDFVFVPENFIRPEFCIRTLWFSERVARTYYFYVPIGITIVCNICLFISTALTIARHKKTTDQHLRNSENRRQEDNKQWLKMYLKLFILMGIIWAMEIIAVHSWAFKNLPSFIWYPTDMINALQGVIIFIIFVWKKKIWLLLMKRFGCENCLFYKNSTSNDGQSTSTSQTIASRTVSLNSIESSAQPKVSPRIKSSSSETNI